MFCLHSIEYLGTLIWLKVLSFCIPSISSLFSVCFCFLQILLYILKFSLGPQHQASSLRNPMFISWFCQMTPSPTSGLWLQQPLQEGVVILSTRERKTFLSHSSVDAPEWCKESEDHNWVAWVQCFLGIFPSDYWKSNTHTHSIMTLKKVCKKYDCLEFLVLNSLLGTG